MERMAGEFMEAGFLWSGESGVYGFAVSDSAVSRFTKLCHDFIYTDAGDSCCVRIGYFFRGDEQSNDSSAV